MATLKEKVSILEAEIVQLKKDIEIKNDIMFRLQDELKQEREERDTVSRVELEGVLKQLEREKLRADNYERMYFNEKEKVRAGARRHNERGAGRKQKFNEKKYSQIKKRIVELKQELSFTKVQKQLKEEGIKLSIGQIYKLYQGEITTR